MIRAASAPLPLALLFAVLGSLLAASPAAARPPRLALPIDCVLGETCFIQNYTDADGGPGAADFTCGPLSYDGHKGTDFALRTMAEMEQGVAVLAAAPGVVVATRDGMPDTGLDGTAPEDLAGKDCGNGVVLDHGDGWQTQYCHLREGSLAVAKGERVAMGATLGQVGLSGHTEFAHLHLSLREGEAVVDPFNSDGISACQGGDGPDDDLWLEPLAYVPGGIVNAGFATAVPEFADVKSGAALTQALPAGAPALVGWVQVWGGRAGDAVSLEITAPDGSRWHRHDETLERSQARLFRAAGRKAPAEGLPTGTWRLTARLLRAGAVLAETQAQVALGD